MLEKPIISVVIGSYNRLKLLKKTIETVRRELDELPHEIFVVDGGSKDGTMNWLVKQKDIITIVQHNRGQWLGKKIPRRSWGYFMNLGFKSAQGKYVCMLSDDCLVVPGAIKNGYQFFEDELAKGNKVGAVAFYYRDCPTEKNVYYVYLTLGEKMYVNHGLYLKQALEDVGYIDEETYQFYCADCDLCLKMWQQGYQVIAAPNSYIEHYSHANMLNRKSNEFIGKADRESFIKKWQVEDMTGGQITKEFIDPKQTYKKFPVFDQWKIKLLFGFNNLLKKIIKKERLDKIKKSLIGKVK